VTEIAHFEVVNKFDCPRTQDSLNIVGQTSKLKLLKSTFNAENLRCKLSGFISSLFGAIHS